VDGRKVVDHGGGIEGFNTMLAYYPESKLTVVVLNKTYGDLTATLTLGNLTPNGAVKVFLYSSANLAAIVAQPDVAVTQAAGSTSSTLSTTFPAQSITVLVVPKV